MRPVDRPFDSVTLIVATGREEVRRTVRLQSPIDLLEVHMFRKAYSRLCISILALSTWSQNKNDVERTSFSCVVVIAAFTYRLSLRKWDRDIWWPSLPRILVWSESAYDIVIRGTVDADHWSKLE